MDIVKGCLLIVNTRFFIGRLKPMLVFPSMTNNWDVDIMLPAFAENSLTIYQRDED